MENEEVKSLQEQLKDAREAYYNLDPIMSDEKYDALRDRLQALDPKNPEVTAVGASVLKISTFEKVEHSIPMGSLNKVNSEEEFLNFIGKTEEDGADEFIMSHKLDGSSLELVYIDGVLTRGVTRGDGIVGEDITVNISQIPSIPKKLLKEIKGEILVRGEVVMHKDVFDKEYAKEYANPRNTSAGKLRDKKNGGVDCKNLTFYGFELEMNTKPSTEAVKFEALKTIGFKIPWFSVGDKEQMVKFFKEQTKVRSSIPYEIDGEVISVNKISTQEKIGSHNMRPRFKIAWKFDSEFGATKIIDVRWQVGPSGRITPVAGVEPVKVGGVTITSISLHNIKMFRSLELHENDEVLVARANDVIPYITENVTRGTFPS